MDNTGKHVNTGHTRHNEDKQNKTKTQYNTKTMKTYMIPLRSVKISGDV
jgi:hypothetical protein